MTPPVAEPVVAAEPETTVQSWPPQTALLATGAPPPDDFSEQLCSVGLGGVIPPPALVLIFPACLSRLPHVSQVSNRKIDSSLRLERLFFSKVVSIFIEDANAIIQEHYNRLSSGQGIQEEVQIWNQVARRVENRRKAGDNSRHAKRAINFDISKFKKLSELSEAKEARLGPKYPKGKKTDTRRVEI